MMPQLILVILLTHHSRNLCAGAFDPGPGNDLTPIVSVTEAQHQAHTGRRHDADDSAHCEGRRCGALYVNMIQRAMALAPANAQGILAVGSFEPLSSARNALEGWVNEAFGSSSAGRLITYATTPSDLLAANLSAYKLLYVPSDNENTDGGITASLHQALGSIRQRIVSFVNNRGGSMIVLTQAGIATDPWAFLPVPLTFTYDDFVDVDTTGLMSQISPQSDSSNLDHSYWHGYWTGPVDWNGLTVMAHKAGECPVASGPNQDCKATGEKTHRTRPLKTRVRAGACGCLLAYKLLPYLCVC
ncbi:hypothetical protein GPECTOR_4g831 [Gonium pectorale]|uniref:Uncharacterized protein n=1 Tax=Gonium pectorale TaxID=33097 RepID=A0A150GY54_GONPE|nr:hypothetical protein GPECTOR_4g831 [Gonium pectorale]|eukprot:KXZ54761.1 hypothetical protein GPECTOR_4g831 [Gonium pectorale]